MYQLFISILSKEKLFISIICFNYMFLFILYYVIKKVYVVFLLGLNMFLFPIKLGLSNFNPHLILIGFLVPI